jgi:hypothetical protein
MKRRAKETSPEALFRRRAFYLRLPQEMLRKITARKAQAAIPSAEEAEASQATSGRTPETLKIHA